VCWCDMWPVSGSNSPNLTNRQVIRNDPPGNALAGWGAATNNVASVMNAIRSFFNGVSLGIDYFDSVRRRNGGGGVTCEYVAPDPSGALSDLPAGPAGVEAVPDQVGEFAVGPRREEVPMGASEAPRGKAGADQ
jgi:hypothetical protein